MNQNQLLKQMIDFNRTSVENAFNTMTVFQEQAEKAASASLDQATWLAQRRAVDCRRMDQGLQEWA